MTIEPAITHGIADHVGSLAPGRLADIVLWKPAYFGVKPEFVLKAGFAAWAPLGEGNATVERAEPTRYRPDWGGSGRAAASLSLTFVSARGAADPSLVRRLAAGGRSVVAVRGTRGLTRADLALNRATAPIEIDPTRRPRHASPGVRSRSSRPRSCRSIAATGCADRRRSAQMSPTVKPSGNGSVGSTT